MKPVVFMLLLACLLGCAMFEPWKAIPPPEGCDQCHQQAICHDWAFGVRPVALNSASGRNSWQQPASMDLPEVASTTGQSLATQRCFRCHKSPDQLHLDRQGRYHQ